MSVRTGDCPFFLFSYFGEDENEKQKVEVMHLSKVALLHLNGADAGLLDLDGESIIIS